MPISLVYQGLSAGPPCPRRTQQLLPVLYRLPTCLFSPLYFRTVIFLPSVTFPRLPFPITEGREGNTGPRAPALWWPLPAPRGLRRRLRQGRSGLRARPSRFLSVSPAPASRLLRSRCPAPPPPLPPPSAMLTSRGPALCTALRRAAPGGLASFHSSARRCRAARVAVVSNGGAGAAGAAGAGAALRRSVCLFFTV